MDCSDSDIKTPVPKVSVIMGVYNIASLPMKEAAFSSILEQSLKDLELLVCDDGSEDGTFSWLERLAGHDRRILLLRSPQNEGLASALNRCLAVARGSFIARQDPDDLSCLDRLQKQLDFLLEHQEIAFVGSQVVLLGEKGPWGRRRFPLFPQSKDFLFAQPFCHGASMFRREALERAGGYRVAKETQRAEDYDLFMELYGLGFRGANMATELYWYREDHEARRRREYRYRVDEARVRYRGFRRLRLMPWAWPYVIKPLVVGLIPGRLLLWLKAKCRIVTIDSGRRERTERRVKSHKK